MQPLGPSQQHMYCLASVAHVDEKSEQHEWNVPEKRKVIKLTYVDFPKATIVWANWSWGIYSKHLQL